MAEDMTFAPKADVLSLEELFQIGRAFCELGVKKIRLTGGEPLIRNNVMSLIEQLGALPGLDQLALTSNGSQLQRLAPALLRAGVTRLNVSIDSLNPRKFRQLTRHGSLDQVIAGIDAAREAGFTRIKINAVILKGRNEDEVLELVSFARQKEIDIAFIEEMPLGVIEEHNRALTFCSSSQLRAAINRRYPLSVEKESDAQAGPARYYQMADSRTRVGFISPHSNNFCHLCNRVRVTAQGRLLLCLGNEHSVDLRAVLRANAYHADDLKHSIVQAIGIKPERHYFDHSNEPQILRFMNTTGG